MGEALDAALKPTLLDSVPDWILPDHISLARGFSLTPLVAYGNDPGPAIGILLFSSACDILDGALARARKQTTQEGAALDALCDKVFLIGALLCVVYDRVHPAFVWGVIAIDAAIGIVRWMKRRRDISLNSNPWGKRKTITLSIAIAFVLTNATMFIVLAPFAFGIALCCALMSFVGHLRELRAPRAPMM